MKKIVAIFLLCLLTGQGVFAQSNEPILTDLSQYFDVDLDAPVPDLKPLIKEFNFQTQSYEPRYVLSYELGRAFDPVWRNVITSYGLSEKRIKAYGEDDLFDMIVSLPKETYPYIGPFLHASPNISEKILNLPGIKETKNKFPERIAPRLQHIEDLEFLSPSLYILLMPEMWPQNREAMEKPRIRPAKLPPVKYQNDFYRNIFKQVEENGIGASSGDGPKLIADEIRTLKITKTSPLTSADVKAFINTLDSVLAFATLKNKSRLISIESLINYYEAKNGTALHSNTLKDMVNPCQRLALKIKWAGMETEFLKDIAKQGFNLKTWAWTCDKTIKAYRMTVTSGDKIAAVRALKIGMAEQTMRLLAPKWRERQNEAVQTLFALYRTNKKDVIAVIKNADVLQQKLYPFGSMLVTSPLNFD
ncbi:MAG: hypothetical protein J6X42_05265 [Alphaproteobacteria bacterium]|nr:hypothetical protein [Alphaproteobacteria bacterium]